MRRRLLGERAAGLLAGGMPVGTNAMAALGNGSSLAQAGGGIGGGEQAQGRSRAEQRRERRLEAEEYMPPVQVEMSRTSRCRKGRWPRLFLAAGAVLLVGVGAMEVVVLQAVEAEVLPAAVVVLPVAAGAAGRLAEEKENRRGYQDLRRGLTRPSWRWALCRGFWEQHRNGTAARI